MLIVAQYVVGKNSTLFAVWLIAGVMGIAITYARPSLSLSLPPLYRQSSLTFCSVVTVQLLSLLPPLPPVGRHDHQRGVQMG